jgi:hypothetical protein
MPAPGFALAWTAEAAVATWPLQMPHKQIKWANFLGWPHFFLCPHSPDSAGVGSDHVLAGFAAERLIELVHIGKHIVDAEDGQRMWIGRH